MTIYTNTQIRGAILRAADRIDLEPSCYAYSRPISGEPQGCVLSITADALGLPKGTSSLDVFEKLGFAQPIADGYNYVAAEDRTKLFRFMDRFGGWRKDANLAALALRAAADHFWPASTTALDPAYVAFRSALADEVVS